MSSQRPKNWPAELARIALVLVVALGGCFGCMVDGGGNRVTALPDVGYNYKYPAGYGMANYKCVECQGRIVELWTDGIITDRPTIKLHVKISPPSAGKTLDSNIRARIVDSRTSEEVFLLEEHGDDHDMLATWNHGGGVVVHVPLGHIDEDTPAFERVFDLCIMDRSTTLLRVGRFYAVRMAAKG